MTLSETVFERRRPRPEVVDAALMGARRGSFWLEDAPPGPAHEPLGGDRRADLVVVGGGFTGLWTAVRAKERDPGREVLLIEAGRLGWAASGRNGGFALETLTHGRQNGMRRWPHEMTTLDRLGRDNLQGIEDTLSRAGLDAEFERPGALDVAVEDHQVQWLRAAADEGAGRFLDTDEVRREVNSPTYLAGLQSDGAAMLHPGKMIVALERIASDLGVQIVEGTRATGVEAEGAGGPVLLHTESGTVTAGRIALATNAFPALLKRYRLHTVPVYDYVVTTAPLTQEQRSAIGWAGRQGVGDVANQFHYYRLTADARIMFGGYDAIYHSGGRVRSAYEDRPASYRRLVEHLLTTFPQLEGIRISHLWAGAIDTSTRFCAFTGMALGGRVAHSAGFTGLGVTSSRFAADTMLDRLDGLDTERTRLEMVRRMPPPFPPEPLSTAGVNLTRWSLDRADHDRGRRNLWLKALDKAGLGFDS